MSAARLVLLISGGGRTALNIARVIDRGNLDAEIALVIASRQCAGVERCRAQGLKVQIENGILDSDRLSSLLDDARADLVCMAGYLKLLPIPEKWRGRILNIHPSLLPKFGGAGMYGDRVHRAVLEAREQIISVRMSSIGVRLSCSGPARFCRMTRLKRWRPGFSSRNAPRIPRPSASRCGICPETPMPDRSPPCRI